MKKLGWNIKIKRARKGRSKGLKYQWAGSAHADKPEEIHIRKHPDWNDINFCVERMPSLLSHEFIHQLLWHKYHIHDMSSHDYCLQGFREKENIKSFMDYCYV